MQRIFLFPVLFLVSFSFVEADTPSSGVQLGTFCRVPAKDAKEEGEAVVGSKLLEALEILMEKNPERYERSKKALLVNVERFPEDGSAILGVAFCRVLEGDREEIQHSVDEVSKWIDRREKTITEQEKEATEKGELETDKRDRYGNKIKKDFWAVVPDDVYLGCWVLTRKLTPRRDEFKEFAERFAEQIDGIAAFSGGYVRNRTGRLDRSGSEIPKADQDLAQAFAEEFERSAPAIFESENVRGIRAANLADVMLQLAWTYQRKRDKEKGKHLAGLADSLLQKNVAAARTLTLENLTTTLTQVDMKDRAAEWTDRKLAKDPTVIFKNFHDYQQKYRDAKQLDQLVEVLKGIEPKKLAENIFQFPHAPVWWMGDGGENKKAGLELIEFLCNLKGITPKQQDRIRYELMRPGGGGILDAELFPYLRDACLISVRVPLTGTTDPFADDTSPTPNPDAQLFTACGEDLEPHHVFSWSSNGGSSMSMNLLNNKGTTPEKLEEIRSQLEKIIAKHEEYSPENRRWYRYVSALLLQTMIDLRLQKTDDAFKTLEALENEPKAKQRLGGNSYPLGIELLRGDENSRLEWAVRAFEIEMKSSSRGGGWKMINFSHLLKILTRLDRTEEVKTLGLTELQKIVDLFSKTDEHGNIRDGNSHFYVSTPLDELNTLLPILIDAGLSADILKIYVRDCRDAPWYAMLKGNPNRYYNIKSVQNAFDSLVENATAADFAENIELLIPALSPKEPEEQNEKQQVDDKAVEKPKGIQIAAYCTLPTGSAESDAENSPPSVGSKLLEALRILKEKDPARWNEVRVAISEFAGSNPGDPETMLGEAFLGLLDGENEQLAASIQKLIDWSEKYQAAVEEFKKTNPEPSKNETNGDESVEEESADAPKKPELSDDVSLGCWILAREIYSDPKRFGDLFGPVETLTIFSWNYARSKLDPGNSSVLDRSRATRFIRDFQRFAPEELAERSKDPISAMLYGPLLLRFSEPRPILIPYFGTSQAGQLVQAAGAGDGLSVLGLYEILFSGAWPQQLDFQYDRDQNRVLTPDNIHTKNMNYQTGNRLIQTLQRVLDQIRLRGDDPGPVFEALLEIVLANKAGRENRGPFFGMYENFGGPDGVLRIPAVDLVVYSIDAGRTEELRKRISEKREILLGSNSSKSAGEKEQIALHLDALEMYLALKTDDKERFRDLAAKLLSAIREGGQRPLAGKLALGFAAPALGEFRLDLVPGEHRVDPFRSPNPDRSDLILLTDLIDAGLEHREEGKYHRFAYYVLQHQIAAPIKLGDLERAARWAGIYREIVNKADGFLFMDGFRFPLDNRLEAEAVRAIQNAKDDDLANQLRGPVGILKYFADEPGDSYRYRDLATLLDALEPKLKSLDENVRKELLGELDLETVQRKAQTEIDAEAGIPRVAEDYGFPALPAGKIVYENDFSGEPDAAWSMLRFDSSTDAFPEQILRREITPRQNRTYLGPFYNEYVLFRCDDLPEHRFLRIRFDLFILGGFDGLASDDFGQDLWRMKLYRSKSIADSKKIPGHFWPKQALISTDSDGLLLVAPVFSNFGGNSDRKQSFPDDYLPEFGRKPSWYNKVGFSLWGEKKYEPGYYPTWTGAAEQGTLGYRMNSVYAVDVIVSHDAAAVQLAFSSQLQDAGYEFEYLGMKPNESWGIDNFRLEIVDDSWNATPEELKSCWEAVLGNDALKAAAARWRLVVAGDSAVDWIEQWAGEANNAEKAGKFRTPSNVPGFRVERVLRLIDTPRAGELRKKWFP